MIFAPVEPSGFLAAAALKRAHGSEQDVHLLSRHELARRIYGLTFNSALGKLTIVDLAPTDSVDTLLAPAIERLAKAGLGVRWYYQHPQPIPELETLRDRVRLIYTREQPVWGRVVEESGDQQFRGFMQKAEQEAWRQYLVALATSWDWSRIYRAVDALSRLEAVPAAELAWSTRQLAEVDRARDAVATARSANLGSISVAIVDDLTIPARVRPAVLRDVRSEVDAVALFRGPTNLQLLWNRPDVDLAFLLELDGVPEAIEEGRLEASVFRSHADVVWSGDPPPAVAELLLDTGALDDLSQAAAATQSSKVLHRDPDRIAKGLGRGLSSPDPLVVTQAVGGSEPPRYGDSDFPGSLRNLVELVPRLVREQ